MKEELVMIGALLFAGFFAGVIGTTILFEILLSRSNCV